MCLQLTSFRSRTPSFAFCNKETNRVVRSPRDFSYRLPGVTGTATATFVGVSAIFTIILNPTQMVIVNTHYYSPPTIYILQIQHKFIIISDQTSLTQKLEAKRMRNTDEFVVARNERQEMSTGLGHEIRPKENSTATPLIKNSNLL